MINSRQTNFARKGRSFHSLASGIHYIFACFYFIFSVCKTKTQVFAVINKMCAVWWKEKYLQLLLIAYYSRSQHYIKSRNTFLMGFFHNTLYSKENKDQ